MDSAQNVFLQMLLFTIAVPFSISLAAGIYFSRREKAPQLVSPGILLFVVLALFSAGFGIVGEFRLPPVDGAQLLPMWWLLGSMPFLFQDRRQFVVAMLGMLFAATVMVYPFVEGVGIGETSLRIGLLVIFATLAQVGNAFSTGILKAKSSSFSTRDALHFAVPFAALSVVSALAPAIMGSLKLAQLTGAGALATAGIVAAHFFNRRQLSSSLEGAAGFSLMALVAVGSLEVDVPHISAASLGAGVLALSWRKSIGKKLKIRGTALVTSFSICMALLAFAGVWAAGQGPDYDAQSDAASKSYY